MLKGHPFFAGINFDEVSDKNYTGIKEALAPYLPEAQQESQTEDFVPNLTQEIVI